MGVKIVSVHTCDKCGRESEDQDFNNGNRTGSTTVSFEGGWGAKGHDGAWGGQSYKSKSLLCFSCADEFLELFRNFMAPDTPTQGDSDE